jgi:hypothetical protein
MDEHDLARRAYALPDTFAARLSPADLASVREFAEVGEWGEELDLLVAILSGTSQPVSVAERDELAALASAVGMPVEPVGRLIVAG